MAASFAAVVLRGGGSGLLGAAALAEGAAGAGDGDGEAAPAAARGSAMGAAVGVGASSWESGSSSSLLVEERGERSEEMLSFPSASRALRSGEGVLAPSPCVLGLSRVGTGGMSSSSSVMVVTWLPVLGVCLCLRAVAAGVSFGGEESVPFWLSASAASLRRICMFIAWLLLEVALTGVSFSSRGPSASGGMV